jgi:hypothetical protein
VDQANISFLHSEKFHLNVVNLLENEKVFKLKLEMLGIIAENVKLEMVVHVQHKNQEKHARHELGHYIKDNLNFI